MKRENLTETAEILSDTKALHEIAEALEAHKHGKGKPLEQIREELGIS